uniref:hypothetical protein n=1 Tax=Perenniporia fraxinea TaxID=1350006 RepID=UPI0028E0A25C
FGKLSNYILVIKNKLCYLRISSYLNFFKGMRTENSNNSNSSMGGNNNNKKRDIFLIMISIFVLVVCVVYFLNELTLHELPGLIITFITTFIFFHFIYYKLNFSKNIYIRLLQKFVAYNLCFFVSILIASIIDFYIFHVIFSDGNINGVIDSIDSGIHSKSDDYDLKVPKGPTDAIANAASNITTHLGAAGAGGAVVLKNVPLPPVQRATLGVVTAGATSAAITIGIQGGTAITKNLNQSEAIKNHPYGDPDINRVPSPDPNIINSPLENGDESIPLVDLLLNLVTLDLLELIAIFILIVFNKYISNLFKNFLGNYLPTKYNSLNKFLQKSNEYNTKFMNLLIIFLIVLLLIMILMNLYFSSVLYTQIDDYVLVYNLLKRKSSVLILTNMRLLSIYPWPPFAQIFGTRLRGWYICN